jgi:uncharacterized membrane protein YdbT with pleckstrin-like domain
MVLNASGSNDPGQPRRSPVNYVKRTLGPHERILFTTNYHWLVWLGIALLIAPAPAVAIAGYPFDAIGYVYLTLASIALLTGLVFLERVISTEIAVTSDRFIRKSGLISFDAEEVSLDKIETVAVEQSVLGRLLGYGVFRVHGTGTGSIEVRMIDRPVRLRQQIQLAREGLLSGGGALPEPAG